MASERPLLPPDWTDVVERIQLTLADTLAEVTARQNALEAPLTPERAVPYPGADHTGAFAERVRKAEQTAAEVEASLLAGHGAVEAWLADAAALRQKLATWAARGVR